MKFIISFLVLISFIFADENKTEIKSEIIEILNQGESNASSEITDIIAEKIAENESGEHSQNSDKPTLISVVKEIMSLNSQINELKTRDSNISAEQILNLNENKNSLLAQIPVAITNQNFDRANLLKYTEKKQKLSKILKQTKNKNSINFINAKLGMLEMKINEDFFGTFIKIENYFIQGASKKELDTELKSALLTLENDYTEFENFVNEILSDEILGDDEKENIKDKFAKIKIGKQSADEILSYLLKNSDLLASNIILKELNLKQTLDFINEKMPFNTEKFNVGKLVLITLITLFFYSLRRSLAKFIYFVFKIFNKNANESEAIKSQIIDIIKKPIGVLLIAYSIDICLSIFYYPAPVPLKFGNIFSIIYVVLYAWLIIEILDGYGIMILGSIAKKSGRKEVINLIIKILYIIVIIIALLFILHRLGFNVSALIASLGIGGLAIALATKDIIANFFASIMLLLDNSFSQGDWIEVGGIEGNVVETGLRKTIIRTFDNALVSVPNSKIMESNVKNWNRRKVGRIIKLSVGLSYNSTAEQIKKCVSEIRDMLISHEEIAKPQDSALSANNVRLRYKQNMVSVDDLAGYKNGIFVHLNEFADSSINIYIECFTKSVAKADYLQVREDVLIKIMEIVGKYDAEFAFPSQSIYIEKFPKIEYDTKI